MYLFMNALIVALLVPAGGVNLTAASPTCRAEINGSNLLTVVELPTGIAVEGPWRIEMEPAGGRGGFRVLATLDHVIEKDALTGDRSLVPFPHPVTLQFEGRSEQEVVRRAARVWCATVIRAQENQKHDHLVEPVPTRIAALARDQDTA